MSHCNEQSTSKKNSLTSIEVSDRGHVNAVISGAFWAGDSVAPSTSGKSMAMAGCRRCQLWELVAGRRVVLAAAIDRVRVYPLCGLAVQGCDRGANHVHRNVIEAGSVGLSVAAAAADTP
jgi:hypothetical protein